jgi:hypothetical protein
VGFRFVQPALRSGALCGVFRHRCSPLRKGLPGNVSDFDVLIVHLLERQLRRV